MRRVTPADEWNIYAAQASDGDNMNNDNANCLTLLSNNILPRCQYFAYVEIWDLDEAKIFNEERNITLLWRTYEEAMAQNRNLAMSRITHESQIFPVLKDLFAKKLT